MVVTHELLACGLSSVKADNHGIAILHHFHYCRPCTSRDISPSSNINKNIHSRIIIARDDNNNNNNNNEIINSNDDSNNNNDK